MNHFPESEQNAFALSHPHQYTFLSYRMYKKSFREFHNSPPNWDKP